MEILFNGDLREISDGVTIAALLAELELAPARVAVEVNYDLVPRERHASHVLRAGDHIEVVTLVGGG